MTQSIKEKQIIESLLAHTDVKIGGDRAWDVQVHDDLFYKRVLSNPYLGLGETYMDGMWDSHKLDQFFYEIIRAELNKKIKFNFKLLAYTLKNQHLNLQKKSDAFKLQHYNIGNDLFGHMLDKRMMYTCGYWGQASDLDSAQEAKLDLVCRKVGLKPGMKILDIGCGWGGFMKYAAEKYGVECVGVTISEEQIKLGEELCQGLPIKFELMDYRDIKGEYDAIVSLGMFEHVGFKNHKIFMQVVNKCLKDDGLFLLHTIGANDSDPISGSDPWINKYIFSQGIVPSIQQIGKSLEGVFIMEDWHNFGPDYDKTLMAWYHNFEASWPDLKEKYGDMFFRMWKYYLLSCAGAFRARKLQLWQIVLSKKGLVSGYKSIR
jgi:cyclopropane-fatty-acyl-phospholipid synthase